MSNQNISPYTRELSIASPAIRSAGHRSTYITLRNAFNEEASSSCVDVLLSAAKDIVFCTRIDDTGVFEIALSQKEAVHIWHDAFGVEIVVIFC